MTWISSTAEFKWTQDNHFSDQKGSELVIGDPIGKPLFGWGCCISELGVRALNRMPEEEAEKE